MRCRLLLGSPVVAQMLVAPAGANVQCSAVPEGAAPPVQPRPIAIGSDAMAARVGGMMPV